MASPHKSIQLHADGLSEVCRRCVFTQSTTLRVFFVAGGLSPLPLLSPLSLSLFYQGCGRRERRVGGVASVAAAYDVYVCRVRG